MTSPDPTPIRIESGTAEVLVMLKGGFVEAAERRCRELVEGRPDDPEILHLLGLCALLRGDPAAAIEPLQAAVDGAPEAAVCRCNLGEALRRSGDLDAAAEHLERAVELEPTYVEANRNLGACLFASGRFDEALDRFETALAEAPANAELEISRGDCLRELGDLRGARDAYLRALELDEGCARAHANLGPLFLAFGLHDDALFHCERAIELDPSDGFAYMNLGRCLAGLDRIEEAMEAFAEAHDRMPDSSILCWHIGLVWLEVDELAEAEGWFRRVLHLDPTDALARCGLAAATLRAERIDEAIEAYREVLAEHPDVYEAHIGLGRALWNDGDAAGSLASLRRAAELRPQAAAVHSLVGGVLASAGDVDGAVASHRRALEINPRFTEALRGLAMTLRRRLPATDARWMETLLKDPDLREGGRADLHGGLAMYYQGREDHEAAAEHAERANASQWGHRSRRDWDYNPEAHERRITQFIETYDADFVRETAGCGSSDELPVFVVGLPRSGTTLTESVLAAHPRAHGVGERRFAAQAFARLRESVGDPKADAATAILKAGPDGLREAASWHRSQLLDLVRKDGLDPVGVERVVDKMPDNYQNLGWIATLFPNATIIYCRRDPRDVAVSCWTTQFGELDWACHLEHIAHRILQHERVMAHWREVLPMPIHEVRYEDLVFDQEGQSRRLVDAVGLDWDPACLEFHRQERLVRTASVTQVREPMYSRSVGKWKHYREALAPLLEQLAPILPLDEEEEPQPGA